MASMKIKFVPEAYFIVFLASIVLFHFSCPILSIIAYPYSLFGLALIGIGLLLTLATNAHLLKNKTTIQPLESPAHLVTSGPFRYSRNPIYLGMFVVQFGIAVLCGSLSPLIFPVLFIIVMKRKFISAEERTLEKIFGQEYLNYKSKVRRWI